MKNNQQLPHHFENFEVQNHLKIILRLKVGAQILKVRNIFAKNKELYASYLNALVIASNRTDDIGTISCFDRI